MAIEVVLLGTGNPLPDRDRAGAATLVRAGGRTLLVDAGRAVCMRLAAAGVLPFMLDAVLLTHLHSDHICDLNDVVTTQWVMSPAPKTLRDLRAAAHAARSSTGCARCSQPDVEYRIAHHDDLTGSRSSRSPRSTPGVVLDEDGVRVDRGAHRPPARRADARLPDRARRARRSCSRATPCRAPGSTSCAAAPTSTCRPCSATTSCSMVPMQRFRRHDRLPLDGRAGRADRGARRRAARSCSPTRSPRPRPGSADEWIAIAGEHFDGEIVFGDDLLTISA